MSDSLNTRADIRKRILRAAAELLREGGAASVTTRTVAERAGVQAPTIYRLFGDKDGMLDAVTEHAMTEFSATKLATFPADGRPGTDPVADLRTGWDMTIGFGLANPDLFVIMSDPRRGRDSPAVVNGMRMLEERMRRVAAAGRLAVPEREAVRLIHAAGTGAVLAMLDQPEHERDGRLGDVAFDAIMTQIVVPEPAEHSAVADSPTRSAALALRAVAPDLSALSPGERTVLVEWLDRIIEAND